MRISDWSSDVCSSDLLGEHTRRQLIQVLVLELERAALEALGHGLADDFQREVFAGETATEVDSHAVTSSSSAGVGRVIRTLKSNRGRTSLMKERHFALYHSESRPTSMRPEVAQVGKG